MRAASILLAFSWVKMAGRMPANRTQDACAPMDATFVIIREDLQVDPVTIVATGILIGRLPASELFLNHPSVSRL